MRAGDPIAVSNHLDRKSALPAARIFLSECHDGGAVRLDTEHVHGIDDTAAGMRKAFIALFALFAAAVSVLIVTSLASAASGL